MDWFVYPAIGFRVLIGLVFLIAVISKIRNFTDFTSSVKDLGFKPAVPIAAAVLAGESAVVALLAIPLHATVVAGFAISVVLLASFAIAIAAGIRRGSAASCHCFGTSAAPMDWHHVWRNAVLIVCALAGAGATGPVAADAGVAIAAGVGVIAGGLVVMLDDLRYLFQPTPMR